MVVEDMAAESERYGLMITRIPSMFYLGIRRVINL